MFFSACHKKDNKKDLYELAEIRERKFFLFLKIFSFEENDVGP